ncbi:hypothetical protein HPP05_11420 [Corallococcus exiguus]|uniref:hypothetical protein n=1 Tax=Corallococcus exiguus TaxID=83462 RepID=UPI0014941327|nr:hypothetical protein [Corallococcus exiguus]NPC70356.1 hypothetical protein [Corallococcus exiguus]
MHARNWGALLWLGLVGLGCGGSEGDELSREPGFPAADAIPAGPLEEDSRDITAQACPPGLASRVATVMPPGMEGFMGQLTAVQRTLYFTTSAVDVARDLWRTDGTEAGTVPVKTFPIEQGYFGPFSLVAVGDRLFFQLSTPTTGIELWLTNGTEKGTRLVKDITPGPEGSMLTNSTEVNGRLVFFRRVRQPDTTERTELWRSDGTSHGTVRLRDFGTPILWSSTLKVGNALLFVISDDTGTTMWRTDGTYAGTTVLKRLDAGFTPFNIALTEGTPAVFLLQDGPNNEVWKTDGTPAGTVRLDTFGRPVSLIGALGAHVYLSSVDNLETLRLRIDRLSLSGGGKQKVTTLPNPYAGAGAYPSVAAAATSGGDLYFSMALTELGPTPPLNVSLWATHGTASGTRQLFPAMPGSDMFAYPLFATGTGQVFFPALPMAGGVRPYFTRGSMATTGRIAEVSSPEEFTRMGNRVYFTAVDDSSARQLWSVPASFTCPPGPAVAGE